MVMIPGRELHVKLMIDEKEHPNERRPYLGMSSIGDPCARKLWYGFRFASTPQINTARQMRIFARGDIEEARVVGYLKDIVIEVYRPGKYNSHERVELFGHIGEQQEEFIGFAGHSMGHSDGRCINVPDAPKTEHLLEIKTANEKNFKKYIKLESVKEANPGYYGQIQRYMKASGLTRALFIVVNKNTEELYIERVHYDAEYADMLEAKETDIILSEQPPEKEFPAGYFSCGWCPHNSVCHEGARPEQNCRTCASVDLHDGGRWSCGVTEKDLDMEAQEKGCDRYKPLF